jgi:hypothetical protein
MSACACGKPADTIGGLCSRCAALQTLGLGTNASMAEVEGTYRTLVKVWHPDRFQTDLKLKKAAEEKLKEINAAHDYLAIGPVVEETQFVSEEPEPIPEAEPEEQDEEMLEAPEPVNEESRELKRVLKRYQRRTASSFLPRIFFIVGGIAAMAFLWISMDVALSANATTQRPWEEFKTEISRDVHASIVRIWGNATEDLHGSQPENALPPAPPAQSTEPAPVPKATATAGVRATAPAKGVGGAKPYITSGLTPTEVLTALGNPTSSSGEKMFYGGSEIDFRDGHVSGWKIDPKNPIRVKLWPDQPVVPGVQAYAKGSSKSDVIALQGTPTLFSDNEFGYGGSRVYFKSDRVIGWKEDPSSVRLRVVAQ